MSFPPLTLHVQNLACKRGDRLLFSALDMQLENKGMIALKGPNGIGKSSLLRILAGLARPHQGSIKLHEGADIYENLLDHAHFLSHLNSLKHAFSVEENLKFWRSFSNNKGVSVQKALSLVGLPHVINLPCGVLSAGQKRRVAFTRLLVAKRPIWLLDEPTAALDKQADRVIGKLISNHLDEDGLVIAATHLPLLVESASLHTINLDNFEPENAFAGESI